MLPRFSKIWLLFVATVPMLATPVLAGGPAVTKTWGESESPISEREEIVLPLGNPITESPCLSTSHDPSPLLLFGVGAAFSPIAYELGVMWHEGSHALWATGNGAHVTNYDPLPSTHLGHLYFGYTTWTGQMSDSQLAEVYIAPKITDLTLITGYTITNEAGLMPNNKWAQLAINSLAVAAVVDLGHDIFQTYQYNDLPQFFKNAHISNDAPYRVLLAGVTLASAAEVGHGIYKMFMPTKDEPQKVVASKKKVSAFSDFSISPYIGTETIGVTGTL